MSLPHVILTLLNNEKATGYDITKQFDGVTGLHWKASHQHVYKTLKTLVENKQVRAQHIEQSSRPDKVLYTITAKGREAVQEWLDAPTKSNPFRDELICKLMASGEFADDTLTANLKEHVEESHFKLSWLQSYLNCLPMEDFANERNYKLTTLTLRRLVATERAWLSWAESVIAELTNTESAQSTVNTIAV